MTNPRTIPDVSRICSVYRREKGLYDYYRVPEIPGPRISFSSNPVGHALSDVLPKLPADAQLIGSGAVPMGTITSDDQAVISIRGVVIGAVVAGVVSAVVGWLLKD